jgi:hypothetical protein
LLAPGTAIPSGRAADFILHCKRERGCARRASTSTAGWPTGLCERPWRADQTWRDQPLDAFTEDDILALRGELIDAGRDG